MALSPCICSAPVWEGSMDTHHRVRFAHRDPTVASLPNRQQRHAGACYCSYPETKSQQDLGRGALSAGRQRKPLKETQRMAL